jgi:hypothetical protein
MIGWCHLRVGSFEAVFQISDLLLVAVVKRRRRGRVIFPLALP